MVSRQVQDHNGRTVIARRPPRPDYPIVTLGPQRIQRRPVLGGLINEYLPAT